MKKIKIIKKIKRKKVLGAESLSTQNRSNSFVNALEFKVKNAIET